MKRAHINTLPSGKNKSISVASQYKIKIKYKDEESIYEKIVDAVSYSDVFEGIKESHQGNYDRETDSVTIEVIGDYNYQKQD